MEPTHTVWLQVKKLCDGGLDRKPSPPEKWSVPGYYDDHQAHDNLTKSLREDSALAYEEALCFRLLNDSKYAEQATLILSAWSTTLKTADLSQIDTALVMSEFFSTMIQAADLLKIYPAWRKFFFSTAGTFIRTSLPQVAHFALLLKRRLSGHLTPNVFLITKAMTD